MTPDAEDLCRLLLSRAQTHGDQIIYQLIDDRSGDLTSITYGALDHQARTIAAGLTAEGLGHSRLALLMPTSFEFLTAFFGTLYAGGVCAPLAFASSAHALPRLNGILENLRPAAVLSTRAMRSLTQSGQRGASLMGAQRLLCVEDLAAMNAPTSPLSTGPASRLAVLQYTSGSTSRPKGVMLSHANVLANAVALGEAVGAKTDDRLLTWLPLFHDMGLVGGVMAPLVTAVPSMLMSPENFARRPVRWLEALSRHRATITAAPTFAYALCCDRVTDAELEALDLSSLRVALCGAEPVPAATMARFQARFGPHGLRPEALSPCYGLAEATVFVSASPPNHPFRVLEADAQALAIGRYAHPDGMTARSLVSSGQPHPDQHLRIVDPVLHTLQSEGNVGEVWISGSCVAAGYHSLADESEEVFGARLADVDGPAFMRTGDLGMVLDGELYITGRLKDLIIVRGTNHYPQDLEETAIASDPLLKGSLAAAFSLDGNDGDRVAIVVEAPRQFPAQPAQLAAAIRREVAAAHGLNLAAVALVRLAALPRTSSGKIRRREVRERFEKDDLDLMAVFWAGGTKVAEASVTDVEGVVAEIVAEILNVERVGLDDDFFELGGDSLKGMQVAGELHERLRVDLPLETLFEASTVRALVSRIRLPSWEEIEL